MANNKIKVGIIGLGMVGEPIRRWFEEKSGYKRGRDLFCYDVDSKKGYSDDVNKADVIFVSVPTPTNPDGSCNVSIVELAVAGLNDGKIVVVKSTVTPGTVERLQKKHPKKRLIFNPEFLTESQAWEDYLSPDRQIVGHTAKSISDAVEVLNLLPKKHFIRPWTSDYSKKSVNATEAELGKYASNVFGYLKVIYGNVLADFCYALGKVQGVKVDYENIKELIGADLRGADLGDADLEGADLEGADLRGTKGYRDSHDIFTEVVRRQKVEVFIEAEWSAIALIVIHRLCWDAIKKRFPDVMPHIFEILAQAGFDEWQKYWNRL